MICMFTSNNFLIASLSFLTLLLLLSQSYAGSEHKFQLTITPDKQFDFSEYYFSKEEYSRAIDEYKRFIYFFPEDERVKLAIYKIGVAYFKSSSFKEAKNFFKNLIEKYKDTELAIKSHFMVSRCHIMIGEPTQAIINLHNLIAITDDSGVRDEAYYRIGWIYIEMGSWEEAKLYFAKISSQNINKYKLKKLSAELDKETILAKKNPAIAGFASIIPGAGYMYCNRYRDALLSFLLNGSLMLAAYESFDDDNNALGGLITFVEIGFYTGNIYGAITSAHKYNRNQTGRFIEELKKNLKISLLFSRKHDGIELSLNYAF